MNIAKLPEQYRLDVLVERWPRSSDPTLAHVLGADAMFRLRLLRGQIAVGIVHEFDDAPDSDDGRRFGWSNTANCRSTLGPFLESEELKG